MNSNLQHDQRMVTTLTVATANVLNLANPGRMFYENQDTYSANEFERKIEWLGGRIAALNADVLAVQEVWDEAAIKAAVARSGLRYSTVAVPGAENNEKSNGAQNTPRVGIVTRLEVEKLQSFVDFPPALRIQIPGLGEHAKFERPPLLATLRMKHGQVLHMLTAHMKSKRPKFLQDANGDPTEDREDPKILALATLRSLMMRGAEAAAMRHIVADVLQRTHAPLIVMGDFNDGPHSVTTQMIAATGEVVYDRGARDTALWNAYEVQGEMALKRDVAYSHVHQGSPEVLDQIFVSEEFLARSKFSIGDVRRVDYFNDHLQEGRDRSRSDHGFVRAVIRVFQ
ncbi:endonuclease/exonuclease/phosphatase family protein [Variovorax sp. PCZ-1]|uniref:endonuclease/exonuclease/phosphatase family protein n=1 Tax=Variovorax sp. PCZ-1 TaxID=2835533 RepID=UPI001BCB87E3|nr:endonuclease/exonuclease/phosphatase family protein [Variovorax sp. PCZ-1]MBS7807876.1 endonuclease/exonuclease/phosphatase family protein [Variovorax sp. PCZ-1]